MKKLVRNPEKHGVLDLFSAVAAENGYDITDELVLEDFIERVRRSIATSKKSGTAIFGKRTESMFAYVSGALGKVSLLKQEDAGDLYFVGNELVMPDYRLTLHDSTQLLVEVKNFHSENPQKRFSLSKAYYSKLAAYSDLNNIELKFAVFFSAWNHWTLLSIQSFEESDEEYSISFPRAMGLSEMSILGDCMIGTSPDLELHLIADPGEASTIDESGKAIFVTRDIKMYCAGKEITAEAEKKIAFYFMLYGEWVEQESVSIVEDGKLQGVKFVYSPEQQEEPNFAIVGRLSQMVSNGFREKTVTDGEVTAITLGLDPSVFGVLIPDDYIGEGLPLWRFIVQSNPEFQELTPNAEG